MKCVYVKAENGRWSCPRYRTQTLQNSFPWLNINGMYYYKCVDLILRVNLYYTVTLLYIFLQTYNNNTYYDSGKEERTEAVSYTHLDVYKRQC